MQVQFWYCTYGGEPKMCCYCTSTLRVLHMHSCSTSVLPHGWVCTYEHSTSTVRVLYHRQYSTQCAVLRDLKRTCGDTPASFPLPSAVQ